MVDRYKLSETQKAGGWEPMMRESKDGEWVDYEDYASIEKQLADLQAAYDVVWGHGKKIGAERDALAARLARLREWVALHDEGLLTEFDSIADSASVQPVCNWHADAEWVWRSDCEVEFSLEDDPLPSAHRMKFCHGCGKPLVEHPYVEPELCGECGEELTDGICPDGCTTSTVDAATK